MLNSTKQLQIENSQLEQLLNSTVQNFTRLRSDYDQLKLLMNQTSKQLQTENKKQRSILFSEKLSFIWRLCNRSTLQCTRCLPGWVEHASRCFFLSPVAEKWEVARRNCLEMGGDLAVVLSPEDQAFLTNLTYQFGQENPQVNFHSAWIGLISSDCVAIVPPRHVGVGKWLNSWDDIFCFCHYWAKIFGYNFFFGLKIYL
uniref:C-type lectin domain-containing protein n=1 Tax=Echeneis naucrates TaxID=173247 RepID=A0A665W8T9_ECHNA